ncbi:NEDD4-binding protein 2-like 1 isoform 2 [Schistosoma japonicum]|uniref:NEDD4-binding protein 2-like 1 isoform 2 n=1 Tax=Schistosoma japonicum TaxID=6182 RepID=A0A4Z2CZ12_SCHJA|nr:NEDD4-binding protein 2-like 1 isoform 2 [Schistosoma japonicum]
MASELCTTECSVSQRSSAQKDLFPYSSEIMRLYNVIYEAHSSGWSTKFLVLLRGLPGSGKSTLARFLTRKLDHHNFLIASNDDYFYDEIENAYKYDNRLLSDAIAACKLRVWSSMLCGLLVIIVDNCNLTLAEIDPFIREGVKRNYSIHLLEPNTPWRYNPKKLIKLTHHTNLNLSELNRMLTLFQQKLNLETILSQFSLMSSSSLSPVLLQNENSFNQNHTAIAITSSTSIGNNSNNLSEHVCYHSNNNVGNDNETRDDTNLAQSNNIKTSTNSNNISDNNNATNTSNTTGNFDELDHQGEIWDTPTGRIEDSDINHVASSEPGLRDSSHYETTTNNTLTTSPLPQPSTSGGKLSELMSIFPNLKTNLLEEFLTLAHDDVSWATTLILDNHTCERFGQQIEHDSDPVENTYTFSSANQTSSNPSTTITYAPSCCSNISNDSRIDTDQNVVSLVKESQDVNETTFTINHQSGIKLSRHFLQAAYEEYAFSLGLSDLDISSEAIPDFIINEWTPEPNLTKEIFISFLRYLGVFSSVTTNILTPKFPSLNSRNSNQIAKKSSITSERSSSKFLQIMHDEEGLRRSVEDFRTSLSTPVVRLILNRLMSKFPGTQKNVIEEAFVRCEFDEAWTEVYLLTYYKSSCESITKSSAINSTAPTTTIATSNSSLSQFYNKDTSATMNQQSFYPSTVMPNYPVGLDCRITEENLSLREIQDEEEALNRSIEDQRDGFSEKSRLLISRKAGRGGSIGCH